MLQLFHQPPGTLGGALRSSGSSTSSQGSFNVSLCTTLQPCLTSANREGFILRLSMPSECLSGFAQPSLSSPRVGVDSLSSGLSRGFTSLACDSRSLCDESEPSASSLLFADAGSSVGRHGCHDAVVGRHSGLRLSPFRLLQRVLSKVRQSRGLELTLVTPFWPQHPWFPDLLELLVDLLFFLPRRKDLLRQLHFHRFHQNLPVLHLTAYHLSSDPHTTSGSLWQWLANLPTADDLPHV